ncbi:MAG: hypothetical protein MUE88_02025 [Flavobacteriales bacterium]|jgi:hypothetical protein|nr:hypothetical protein [Flavobacteriales bacterium]
MRKALVTFASATLMSCANNSNEQCLLKMEAVPFRAQGETLFIEARTWGLAGNHEQILIKTDSTKRDYDKERDYAFVTDEIYYRSEADTLLVYAPYSGIMPRPMRWPSQVIIACIALNRYDQVMDYRMNYAQYGLRRVSVYHD